ncbi:cellulose binding domain-containing protein [Herbivorax sp. ANBcel31]|uniref:cellulose binding domain-containing protein n=1 Tax=Herbivorax sp. ANBcel31 TaxID=3069754 RepID=UPI0027B3BBE7|nr:cellulose binding domain-containing protein [Herbivorax sp. ANBcel31]MDQ2084940.1 cellulose binding domain-containing protein [Herbivorax sp. ANBcel31]
MYMRNYRGGIFLLTIVLCLLLPVLFNAVPSCAASESEVSFEKLADWKTGFLGSITIKNNGDKEIDQWKLEFDLDSEITDIWNAEIVTHEDNRYVVTFKDWNKVIEKGKSVTFGFIGKPGQVSEPSDFKLSDIYDELAQKDKEWQDYTASREAEEMQKSLADFAIYYGIVFESQHPFTIGYSIMEKDPFKDVVTQKYETVYIPTKDGLKLKGAFFPVKNPKGTIIVMHGRNSYAAEAIQSMGFLVDAGYQVLVYNARVWNYYETPKEYVGDVRKDVEDIGCAIEYLKSRHDVDNDKIGICGASYGASKAIAAGSKYKEDIKIVISDAAMAYLGKIYGMERDNDWLEWMKRYLNLPLEQDMTEEIYKCVDYTSAIEDIQAPVLILHGLKDELVLVSDANMLYDSANEPKEVHYMPNSGHCDWFLTEDKIEYQNTVLNFLDKYFK